jgi:hypothetical protein
MRGGVVLGLAAALGAGAATAAERRELGAHVHGRSTLAVAVEGTRVTMELVAPGMDIVGFEHAAGTDEQRAAVERAKAALADPLALFVLPPASGCGTAEATVGLEAGESHAEFYAEYALDCANPAELGSITFVFFEHFPAAEEVEVTLVTERRQTTYEVTRATPRLVLGGPI